MTVGAVVMFLVIVLLTGMRGAARAPTERLSGASHMQMRQPLDAQAALYYPGGWLDAAVSGVPDVDQKQSTWVDQDANWSWDGPVAVANALWYLDSVLEPSPVPPPTVNDNFPLVEAYQPGVDDHVTATLESLAFDLAGRMDTDGQTTMFAHRGTDPLDVKLALDIYLQDKGVDGLFQVNLVAAPPFSVVAAAVMQRTPVVLLLGFWQQQPADVRLGGHWVTVAGVDVAADKICFADPFVDNAESGGDGVVRGHTGGAHGADVHNDPANVSYDCYVQGGRSGPGGAWGPNAYLSLAGVANFVGDMNNTADLAPFWNLQDDTKPLLVKAEYALIIEMTKIYLPLVFRNS